MNIGNPYLTSANFSINCGSFSLTGVRESDYETLYKYESDEIFNLFCLNRINLFSRLTDYKERFKRVYSKQRHLQFLIRDNQGKNWGTIIATKKGLIYGHSSFCIYLEEAARSHPIGWYAIALFLRYMFEKEKLLKIYTEIMNDNELSIRCAKYFGMVEEGYYPKHYLRPDGSHIGVYIFTLYPSTIDENGRKYRTNTQYQIELDSLQ